MAVANKAQVANLTQYTESINSFGELVISAKDGSTTVAQTIACETPCLIMYNPANFNFYAYHDIREMEPGMKFVSVVTSIA